MFRIYSFELRVQSFVAGAGVIMNNLH